MDMVALGGLVRRGAVRATRLIMCGDRKWVAERAPVDVGARSILGRAEDGGWVIEGPPYADSLLVTSGPAVLARLLAVGLEVHEVTKALPIPVWRD